MTRLPIDTIRNSADPRLWSRSRRRRPNGARTGSYSRSSAEGAATDDPWISKPERLLPVCVGMSNTHARRIGMSTSEERALVTEIEDRLIELYVQQDEAKRAENRDRARELEIEIRG